MIYWQHIVNIQGVFDGLLYRKQGGVDWLRVIQCHLQAVNSPETLKNFLLLLSLYSKLWQCLIVSWVNSTRPTKWLSHSKRLTFDIRCYCDVVTMLFLTRGWYLGFNSWRLTYVNGLIYQGESGIYQGESGFIILMQHYYVSTNYLILFYYYHYLKFF